MAFVSNFIPYGYGVAAGSGYLYLKGNILSVDMKHPSICKTLREVNNSVFTTFSAVLEI